MPQHACILVSAGSLANGVIELEVKRKGRVEASARIPFKEVCMTKNGIMKLRKLVVLSPGGGGKFRKGLDKKEDNGGQGHNRFDLEMELQLFALSKTGGSALEPQTKSTLAQNGSPLQSPAFLEG